jgi:hypothetical protein
LAHELPPAQQETLRRALRLAGISVLSAMGGSQAMKTAWIDDMLNTIPPVAVPAAYGFHRCVAGGPRVAVGPSRACGCASTGMGEVFVVPVDEASPLRRVREAHALARAFGWRIHDLTVQLCDDDEGARR